ncbi:hypothetical protein ABN702_17745 [Bacillus haimaensis]|uniref:hypothetical protein n=1 Tax=Bacillus haimaensis TaxID=3160967 RepID=UPI003AA8E84A
MIPLFSNLGGSNEASFSLVELVAESEEEVLWRKNLADREIVATKNRFVDQYLFQTGYGDKVTYQTVNYNESSAPGGGVIYNIPTDFPYARFSPATDREYDWQSLRFVYQEHEGEWLLYAIVRDVHNP